MKLTQLAARKIMTTAAVGSTESRAAGRVRPATVVVSGITLLLGLTGMVSATAQASQPATASARTWTTQATPNQPGAGINDLGSVSCTSPSACTAVGTYADTLSSPIGALAERWNGQTWGLQAPAKPKGATATELFGVSCAAANACTAVGVVAYKTHSGILAEAWNGKSWRVQATPRIKGVTAGALYSVSCTSASACTAVGQYQGAVAERWNGKTWSIQAIPHPAKLTWFFGVSCSTARACTAVGYQNSGTGDAKPFAEGWNGTSWHVQTVPLPKGAPGGAFSAVSCTTPSACTATGTSFGDTGPTLAERWNGTSWRIQPTPNPPGYQASGSQVTLKGVSCTSATACTATGDYSMGLSTPAFFAEAWNGTNWKLQTTPDLEGGLAGVSCVRAICTAVGAYRAPAGQLTLAITR